MNKTNIASVRIIQNSDINLKKVSNTSQSLIIHRLSDIYDAVDISEVEFLEWQTKYGLDSKGVSPSGIEFIPGYPLLSRISWMHIEPVRISGSELLSIANECDLASKKSEKIESRELLKNIAAQARTAFESGSEIEFGPP